MAMMNTRPKLLVLSVGVRQTNQATTVRILDLMTVIMTPSYGGDTYFGETLVSYLNLACSRDSSISMSFNAWDERGAKVNNCTYIDMIVESTRSAYIISDNSRYLSKARKTLPPDLLPYSDWDVSKLRLTLPSR